MRRVRRRVLRRVQRRAWLQRYTHGGGASRRSAVGGARWWREAARAHSCRARDGGQPEKRPAVRASTAEVRMRSVRSDELPRVGRCGGARPTHLSNCSFSAYVGFHTRRYWPMMTRAASRLPSRERRQRRITCDCGSDSESRSTRACIPARSVALGARTTSMSSEDIHARRGALLADEIGAKEAWQGALR